jgi:hypothetical protein
MLVAANAGCISACCSMVLLSNSANTLKPLGSKCSRRTSRHVGWYIQIIMSVIRAIDGANLRLCEEQTRGSKLMG